MICNKCGNYFSSRLKLEDGKSVILTRRKTCYKCFPYIPRTENSQYIVDDNSRICKVCKNTVIKDKTKGYICNKCYKLKIKKLLVEYKGGKCIKCGYDKCLRALSFHHIRDKKFTISQYKFGLEKMKEEVDKCLLLCANCHMELHEN